MSTRDCRPVRLSRREAVGLLGLGLGFGALSTLEEIGLEAAPSQAQATSAATPFPKGAIVRTLSKDVSPETLRNGATLFHQHLSMTMPRPFTQPCSIRPGLKPPDCRPDEPIPPDRTENIDLMIEEVRAAAQNGVSCIVDGGGRDLGRSIEQLRQIASRTGMPIVASGGYHTQPRYPPDVARKTDVQVVDDFMKELEAERWGALGEIGSSMEMHAEERKVFRAIGKVHERTGLPVFTHTNHEGCRKCALEQLDLLESLGVGLQKLCIGHLADIRDDPRAETHVTIAKRGAFVGFDTVGRPARIQEHVTMVMAVLEAGYEDHVLLSTDGGSGTAVLTVFVPKLKEAGVTEPTIHKILTENPLRFLAFVPKQA